MKFKFCTAEQGTDQWFLDRKGRITGSRFKDARDRLKNGSYSAKATLYAENVARERRGGKAEDVFQSREMRFGTEQEPLAISAYETTTGNLVERVGFAASDCGMFGLSPDGLVCGKKGAIEVKTMVSSDTLWTAVVNGDYSAYKDQINGYLLFLELDWVDLVLWTPDMEDAGLGLVISRIERDEKKLAELKADLDAFAVLVRKLESELHAAAVINRTRLADLAEVELETA